MRVFSAMMIPLLLTVSAAAQEIEVTDNPIADIVDETEIGGGVASYYGNELAGNRTASGERFDPGQLTAAHRSLPFGSMVRVTNTSNGDSVIVRINDRGPFAHGRVIDVSHAAAREIGMHRSGTARVKLALLNDD
jgi:rare lipoprotein A